MQFTKALEAFRDLPPDDTQLPLEVFEEFQAVPESSTNYERALVYAARCLVAAGQLEEAQQRFTQIQDRAADSSLEPTNDAQRNKREIALAEARYFHAQLLLGDAVNEPEKALETLANFESDAPGQESFHPRVKWQRVIAHAKANQVEAAENALEILRDSPGVQPTFISSAAYRVATALKAESDRLEEEGQDKNSNELLRRAAVALEVYAESDGYSSFRNLTTIGEWYLAAGENTDALRLFEKAEEVHGDNSDVSELSMDGAKIGQARSLDAGLDFARSRPIWMDLLNRNPNKFSIMRGAARSLGGWLQIQTTEASSRSAGPATTAWPTTSGQISSRAPKAPAVTHSSTGSRSSAASIPGTGSGSRTQKKPARHGPCCPSCSSSSPTTTRTRLKSLSQNLDTNRFTPPTSGISTNDCQPTDEPPPPDPPVCLNPAKGPSGATGSR